MGRIALVASGVSVLAGTLLTVLALTEVSGIFVLAPTLFVFLASLGFVLPNATALAMENHGARCPWRP